jgi:hypothetical protein
VSLVEPNAAGLIETQSFNRLPWRVRERLPCEVRSTAISCAVLLGRFSRPYRKAVSALIAGIIGAGRSWTAWMIAVLSMPRR